MCCSNAAWKREEVPDHKFDFINVQDFRTNSFGTRLQYAWLWLLTAKTVAVYIADIYTAIALLASNRWSNSILQSDAAQGSTTLNVPFTIGKWVFTGCIILSFLLLAWEARKARAIIRSRDISYAFTNIMSQDFYSMKSYDYFCFFCQINNSKKKKDEFAFFVFFTFKSWKSLLLADAARQVINAITLYSFGASEKWSTDFSDYHGGSGLKGAIILTMLFTLVIWVGSAILLLIAAVMYVPLLCYVQGNLKEYCCHKVDKRIAELMKRKNRKRLAQEAQIAKKEALGDYSHLRDKKGKITSAPRPQPTLPKIGLEDEDLYAPSYAGSDSGSIRNGKGGNYQYPPSHYNGGGNDWDRKGTMQNQPSTLSRSTYPYNASEPDSIHQMSNGGAIRGGYAESVNSLDGFANRGAQMGYNDSSTALNRPGLGRNDTQMTRAPSYQSEYDDGYGHTSDPYARPPMPSHSQSHISNSSSRHQSESSINYPLDNVGAERGIAPGRGYGGGGNGGWDPADEYFDQRREQQQQAPRSYTPGENVSATTLGACCISGSLHEGSPKGTVQKIDGLDVYVTGDVANKKKTIVYITDIFGFQLPNARLLADEIASNGFYVVIPDLFKNDSLDASILAKIAPRESAEPRTTVQAGLDGASAMASLGPWLVRQREAVTKPLIESFVATLRKDPAVEKIGATGYCWGGRYSILLANGQVDAAVACHPSFLVVPEDLKNVVKPISIAVGTKDGMFVDADQAKAQAYLANELKAVPTEFVQYPNEVHGFAVRGDINVPSEKKAKEDATKQTIEFFKKHLA